MDIKLAMKIYNVMCDSIALEKDTVVGEGTKSAYRAVGEASVLNALKPLFKAHKLICLPEDGTIEENISIVTAYGKESSRCITQLKVSFKIVDAETGEEATIVGFGNGADSQDKGSGKAFTYAYKTALQKTFMLFSGEDTDTTHSDQITKSQEIQQKPTGEQLDNLVKTSETKNLTYEQLEAYTIKKFKKSFTKISYQDYKVMLKHIEGIKVD